MGQNETPISNQVVVTLYESTVAVGADGFIGISFDIKNNSSRPITDIMAFLRVTLPGGKNLVLSGDQPLIGIGRGKLVIAPGEKKLVFAKFDTRTIANELPPGDYPSGIKARFIFV